MLIVRYTLGSAQFWLCLVESITWCKEGELMDSSHLHPKARRLGFLFKLGCHDQDHAFFSKLASKAKMFSPSHPRAEIPHM